MIEDKKIIEYSKLEILWMFMKYQIITKGVLFVIVYPIYTFILNFLISNSGRVGLSSGDYLSFIFSLNGIGVLITTIILMSLLIALDINTFIIMTSLIKEGKVKIDSRYLIKIGIRSIKSFLSPIGLIMMLYVSLIFPIIGVGISISPMKSFQIPNFISSVIFSNTLYSILYYLAVVVFLYITYRYIFTFHFILINGDNIKKSLNKSSKYIKKYWKLFIKEIILKFSLYILIVALIAVVFAYLIFTVGTTSIDNIIAQRTFLISLLLTIAEIISISTLALMPIFIMQITNLFYKISKKEGHEISCKIEVKDSMKFKNIENFKRSKVKTILTTILAFLIAFNIIIATLLAYNFDEIFKNHKEIELVAHRGGGDLGAENSLEGIKKAIEHGANWTEIDIQRTRDGHYVLNHDKTFKRLAGDDRKAKDMTLEEIKQIRIENAFDKNASPQEVATLDEVIETAKDKLGLFIELKGETADKKMVDDVVSMIKENKIENQAVILSLDYPIIEYVEEKYPEISSGYLYFFSVGDGSSFKGDYLIIEEGLASQSRILSLKDKGKKVVVWTINTDESVKKFVNYPVDGIITDYLEKVKQGIKYRDNKSDLENIIDYIFN